LCVGGKQSEDYDIVVNQEIQDDLSGDEEYDAPKKLKMIPTNANVIW
jgi:hypothetical protein